MFEDECATTDTTTMNVSLQICNASGVASFADGGGATVGFFVSFLHENDTKEYLYRTTYFIVGGCEDKVKPLAGAKQPHWPSIFPIFTSGQTVQIILSQFCH